VPPLLTAVSEPLKRRCPMRRKFYWLLLLLLGLPNLTVATREICGEPPPHQFKEESYKSIKGDLEGKANFLSSWVGKVGLGTKIESTRKEIFAKYSDANAAYMDQYLLYMFCYIISDPKNKQDPNDKIKAIMEFRQQQQRQPPPQLQSIKRPIDPDKRPPCTNRNEPWGARLIGSWKADVLYGNIPDAIVYTFNPDGSFLSNEPGGYEERRCFQYLRGHVLIDWDNGVNEDAELVMMDHQFRYRIVYHTDQRAIGQEYIFRRLGR